MENTDKYNIDISQWKRQDHYNFFRNFQQPFFGVTSEINCTQAYRFCKSYKVPFLMYYLHKSLAAANLVREFRYRIQGDNVIEYAQISGSITVLRNDETFGFAYFNYHKDFGTFAKEAQLAINSVRMDTGLKLESTLDSIIHYSILPGIRFSSMQHAQMTGVTDSIPKIVFGKLSELNDQVLLPVSVHVNHALCDGLHVTKFFETFATQMKIG
ncbi:chloramphenicol acetyltransferase [Pedobacter boryungensis]|uniref:Chloramphenicol acetyltransferase n=1 Tax=Pedobacter boryungensis TaxID=869962 RepID=A0ABX2DBQ8_9SPHI|nr:chloramphenicol acetyltransferase [Pedobacter boryungensis]NQX30604.1 chloramphenicol acetyltransferase [Pedobacter boryungensis]